MFRIRTCAGCARSRNVTAYTLLIKWAREGGVRLANPYGYYLCRPCADRIRRDLMSPPPTGGVVAGLTSKEKSMTSKLIGFAGESMKDVPDQTYCLRTGEHYALVGGRTFGPWPDAGAAQAGLETEQRRAAKRRAS